MEKKETKMQIPKITLDSLFTTQEQRDEILTLGIEMLEDG